MILSSTASVFLCDNYLIRQFLNRQNWDTLLVPKESDTKLDTAVCVVVDIGMYIAFRFDSYEVF